MHHPSLDAYGPQSLGTPLFLILQQPWETPRPLPQIRNACFLPMHGMQGYLQVEVLMNDG